jgi:RNA recognition motif-containing protein
MFKIFVGNLEYKTSVEAIRDLFERHFAIDDVAMAVDPATGKSRGFAIVMTKDEVKARAALAQMRGVRLDGRLLIINEARGKGKKGDSKPGPGARGGSRGGGSGGGHRPFGRSFRAGGRPYGAGMRGSGPRRRPDDSAGPSSGSTGAGPSTPPR